MWSSTSDNKKKEDLDDCSCSSESSNTVVGSSSSAAAASSTTTAAAAAPRQQQKLNTFDNTETTSSFSENNSNISINTIGGNDSKNDASNVPGHRHQQQEQQNIKEKELEGASATETGDSGFISGPQSNIFSSGPVDKEDGESKVAQKSGHEGAQATKTVNKALLNIAAAEHEEEKTVLDSGCIDEEFEDEYEAEQKQNNKEQENEAVKQSSSSHLSGSAIAATAAATAATTTATENQMILKQNVDAGMSEWFCNLSLQNVPTTQQQQATVAAVGMNNLDSAGVGGRRSAPNAGSTTTIGNNNQSRQQQQAAGNSATNTSTTSTIATSNLTPSNAWEQFYQQNDDGDTPLHLACISGYVDVVAALIRMAPHPCLFNIQNDEAQTPLHLATLTVQPKILRMLLIAGAEPTIRDRHGNTALHLACVAGEEQCVRALTIPISASEIHEAHRQYGHRSNDKTVSYLNCARLPSDLEIRNYDGERCVHLAAQAGHIDVLRHLVLYGADINAREGKSGRTPLHIAIECCNEDLANFLLDECLKLNLETATYAGLTAYQVACILNKSQMQNILEKRGAEPLTPPDSDYDSSDIETDLDDSKMYDRFGDPGYFISYNGGNPMTVA